MLQEGKGHVLNSGRHGIPGVDRTDHDGPVVGALSVADAGGAEIGHDGEVLPDLAGQAVLCKLLPQDRVGLSHSFQAVTGDGADTAHAEAWAREGLTVDHAVRQAQFAADNAHFILEEDAHRLDQFKVQVRGQTAGVVVGLDAGFAFQNVRPDGALRQQADAVQLPGFLGKDLNKLIADDLSLGLGIRNPGQLVQKTVNGIDIDQVGVHLIAENLDHLFRFPLAQQAVVDMDTGQLLSDRLDQQGGNNGRIHAAGESEKDLAVSDLRAQSGNLLIDKRFGKFGCGNPLHGFGSSEFSHFVPPISLFSRRL